MRDEAPVQLGDRGFDILCELVAHAPNMVSKKVLFDRPWPGLYVEEVNLRFQIGELRKALGEGEQYISTVKGRGYCFVGPVSRAEPAQEAALSGNTNLPKPFTNIGAREAELAELLAEVTQHRLITILGSGGVGKTRLAIELGWRALADFPAGAWLLDLAPVRDLNGIFSAAASAFGISMPNTENAIDAIVDWAGAQPRLLILDNCEHRVAVLGLPIQALLEKTPCLIVLATSTVPLGLTERTYHLQPLGVPPADADGTADLSGTQQTDV